MDPSLFDLFEIKFPSCDFEFDNFDTVGLVLEDLLISNYPKVSLKRSKKSLLMLVGAIQSHIEGKRIICSMINDQNIRFS